MKNLTMSQLQILMANALDVAWKNLCEMDMMIFVQQVGLDLQCLVQTTVARGMMLIRLVYLRPCEFILVVDRLARR